MPRRKGISNYLREKTVAAHQSGKGYEAILKQPGIHHFTEKKIIQAWNKFRQLPIFSGVDVKASSAQGQTVQSSEKHSYRATSQTLQASVLTLNVKVLDSTIRRRLNKYAPGESLLSLKRTWQHSLGLQSCIWTKPQDFWNNVLWTDQTKVEMFGHNAQADEYQSILESNVRPLVNAPTWTWL